MQTCSAIVEPPKPTFFGTPSTTEIVRRMSGPSESRGKATNLKAKGNLLIQKAMWQAEIDAVARVLALLIILAVGIFGFYRLLESLESKF